MRRNLKWGHVICYVFSYLLLILLFFFIFFIFYFFYFFYFFIFFVVFVEIQHSLYLFESNFKQVYQ